MTRSLGRYILALLAAVALRWAAPESCLGLEAPGEGTVALCIRPDRSLRSTGEGLCAPGEQAVRLAAYGAREQDGTSDWETWGTEDDESAATGDDRLDALERRLAALENEPLFEVVSQKGTPILTVGNGFMLVHNPAGTAVAAIRGTATGGFFTGRSVDGRFAATVGASGPVVASRILEDGIVRVDLGRQPGGNYALRFPSLGRGQVAGIGESQAGTGALVIADVAGQRRASAEIGAQGQGILFAYNDQDTQVASLTESAEGSGLLVLGDAAGDWRVKMGVLDNRYGFTIAGPNVIGPLIPATGLPGSFLLGCTGGDSCGKRDAPVQ